MVETVTRNFLAEFYCIKEKFKIFNLSIKEAYESKEEYIYHPGVYVFWHGDRIIKVGRHLTNSRKRALEHIRDNTKVDGFQMNSFTPSNEEGGLVLINCINPNDFHWVAAIEIFLERALEPMIRSQRTG